MTLLYEKTIVYSTPGVGKDVQLVLKQVGGIRLSAAVRADLHEIKGLIEVGQPLPDKFYSNKAHDPAYVDELLATYGVIHLHVGGTPSSSDSYLLVQQFEDRIVFLEVHKPGHQVFFGRALEAFVKRHDLMVREPDLQNYLILTRPDYSGLAVDPSLSSGQTTDGRPRLTLKGKT